MWQIPDRNLTLSNHEVHIWQSRLDLPTEKIEQLETLLSEDEIQRANRFHFPQHRRRFVIARGTLRQLLSNYLNLSGDRLRFEYSDRGKPKLAASLNSSNLQFNLSHSEELALYGFTCDRRIGIDLEYLRNIKDVENMARRFFSATEAQQILNLSGEAQKKAFLQMWTTKEAYLKATGEGLSGWLESVETTLDRGAISLSSIRGNSSIAELWFIDNFIPASEYIATVAVEKNQVLPKVCFWIANKNY
ncbi:4'-phosphopantetheinyl transferase superfamily protein [Myxosarcina sp. GI1]|uniref:4'-phosphopantetheinyl transferase family protein n=1 Tax=Myxosarcina sp. GI1 TaxID=1541065 RepID=UPI00055F59CB|nr:4'-phosphopantetheinyl transferase superfamily protein [Myxosarcina sp. GI1]